MDGPAPACDDDRAGGQVDVVVPRRLPRHRLPMVLADVHRSLHVGATCQVRAARGRGGWSAPAMVDVVVGAGFTVDAATEDDGTVVVVATRARTLADTVGRGMRLLVCGLNPSLYSADRGVGYARPGNRFWKAVVEAGLVGADRALDPRAVLDVDRIGITDLCKRATVASAELTAQEYRDGAGRVERLVAWLRPSAVCFVGLEGWRAAVDRRATAGVQPAPFGGRPAYVLPSTSGLNAHSRFHDLVDHFVAVRELAS